MKSKSLTVLIVEDQEMFSEFLQTWIEAHLDDLEQELAKFGQSLGGVRLEMHFAVSIAEAHEAFGRTSPDLVLTDLGLPDGSGVDLANALRTHSPQVKLIGISVLPDEWTLMQLEDSSFDGFVTKSRRGLAEMFGIFASVLSGRRRLSSDYKNLRVQLLQSPRALHLTLTPMETKVFEKVAWGYDDREIGELLQMSPLTARKHRQNLMQKLEVNSSAKLVALAWRLGLGRPQIRMQTPLSASHASLPRQDQSNDVRPIRRQHTPKTLAS